MRKVVFWCCISLLGSCALAVSADYLEMFLRDGFLILAGMCLGAFAYWFNTLTILLKKRRELKNA